MTNSRLVGSVMAAALFVAVLGAQASGNTFSVSSKPVRIVWETLRVVGSITAACEVTLEGSFHERQIGKMEGALMGSVTSAFANSRCITNTLVVLTTRIPWHIKYESFTGNLPAINSVFTQLIGFEVQTIEGFGGTCLYHSTSERHLLFLLAVRAGFIDGARVEGTPRIPRASGGLGCPAEAAVSGNATVEVPSTSQKIAIALI